MSTRFLRSVTMVVLAACTTFAFADTPTRVGRISMSQGQVGISGEQGEETNAALVNWPVTSRNQVTTGRDGRTEIRIGSTAVRLDADSALDITELDDNSLRLHLHYGSASVRLRNADLLRGFQLSTPQGDVRMQEPGQIRVDAGRRQDTTVVSVFSGAAEIDGGGSRLTVRAGKRAEIGQDDVRTGIAMRDSFDEWTLLRDLRDERSESVRYVTNEMTGYEDLDHNGVWREDTEYGPLWSPRNVPYGWAPYRDGRWTYLQPWGWTWVDNASWGYAPFHYGRWVMVNQRWCWAPGRNVSRAIWSPALVGWVGGRDWNASFGSGKARRAAPATGWYPLAPRDAYVPNYRMAHDNLRYLNRNSGAAQPDIRGRTPYRNHDQQRAGLTVVPHEQFRQRGTVVVPTAPRGSVSPAQLFTGSAAAVVPPVPQMTERERNRDWRRVERRVEREDQVPGARTVPSAAPFLTQPGAVDAPRRGDRFGDGQRRERRQDQSVPVQATTMPAPATIINLPSQPLAVQPSREERVNRVRRSDAERGDQRRERAQEEQQRPVQVTATPAVTPPATSMPAPATVITLPSQPMAAQPSREERVNRFRRSDVERDPDVERDRRARGAESFQQAQQQQFRMQQAQQQQAQQQAFQQQAIQQQMQQQQMQQQQIQQQQMRAQQQAQQMQQAQRMQQMQQMQQAQQPRAAIQAVHQQSAVQQQPVVQSPAPVQPPAVQQRANRENNGEPRGARAIRRARDDANLMH